MEYQHKFLRKPSESSLEPFRNTPSSFFKNPSVLSKYTENSIERSRSTDRRSGLVARSFSKDYVYKLKTNGKLVIHISLFIKTGIPPLFIFDI